MVTDPIVQQIEAFHCTRGVLFAERRNRGYTVYAGLSAFLTRVDQVAAQKISS
jgi:hypothetical protein